MKTIIIIAAMVAMSASASAQTYFARSVTGAPVEVSTPPVVQPPAPSWIPCAQEGAICTFEGTRIVRYGAADRHSERTATGSIECSNSVFGDPIVGTFKTCDYLG